MAETKNFVHLHVHTQYSLLDGATRIDKLFKACYDLGMPSIAITDHGNMYGALEFIKAAIKFTDDKADPYEFLAEGRPFKVKPVIGCEVYMAKNRFEKTAVNGKMPKSNHLVLLAKDKRGYHNLIKLVSLAYTEGLYYKPRIDYELLEKYHEGLVCLSACLAGSIPQYILVGDLEGADKEAKYFKNLFGDDFYIEIQDHNIRDQKTVLPHLITVARRNDIKIVATNDVHYLTKKDSHMQKVLQCISFRNTMSAQEDEIQTAADTGEGIQDDSYFPTKEFYLKSFEEMRELFPALPDALQNTVEVADKCGCNFFSKEPLLPSYVPEDGSNPADFLVNLTFKGLNKKYKAITPEIKERADYELGIITRLGFVDYFLIVWDFINWSETHDVPVGPGRGSGVGSIVAYAIGITKVDPLKYQLIFERFLNAERVSNPDFDIDFCVDGREEVINYVVNKYGERNVSQIITFGTLAAKAAVKDVGRVYNHPYSEVEKLTKLIPTMMGKNHIGHLLGIFAPKPGENPEIPELKEIYNNDAMAKNILDMAMKIEGMPRQTGMHAAGVIICRDPISDHVPMAMTGDGIITTEFNMVECEELGLLKMDFLGLRTLTDIKKAVSYVKKTKGIDIDFYDMEYDDKGVYKLIGDGDTHAVFQLESEGMKKFMRDLRPTCLEDVIAGISLYRPGPMDKIPDYVFGKKNPDRIRYDDAMLESILDVTYGVMVYQEQVMKIVQVLGGYSLGRADNVRRMMSKKKKDAMEKEREVFLNGTVDKGTVIPGCIKNGVPESAANKIYDDMISFASYAFNKSHAAAYAFLAYQTAYLKFYHTVEFVTAVLNNRITSIDEIRNYLSYLKERNIAVYPPSINKSYADFAVENGGVRIGLAAIKNVGAAVVGEIVAEREKNGEFTDFVEFIKRMENVSLNKKMLESLIFAGTFDSFNLTRATLISDYESVMDRISKDKKARLSGQFSFFDNAAEGLDEFNFHVKREYDLSEKLRHEKEVAGVYLTGHPLDEYTDYLKSFNVNSSSFAVAEQDEATDEQGEIKENVTAIKEDSTVTVGGMLIEATKRITKNSGKEMGIGKIEDLYGTIELVVSPFRMNTIKQNWVNDKLVSVTGKVRYKDGFMNLWVDRLEPYTGDKSKNKKICVILEFKNGRAETIDELNEVFRAYPGGDLVYVKDRDTGKNYKLGTTVEVSRMLLNELYGIVGEKSVIVAE